MSVQPKPNNFNSLKEYSFSVGKKYPKPSKRPLGCKPRADRALNPAGHLDPLLEAARLLRAREGKVWDACRAGLLEHFDLTPEEWNRFTATAEEWIVEGASV